MFTRKKKIAFLKFNISGIGKDEPQIQGLIKKAYNINILSEKISTKNKSYPQALVRSV